MTKTSTRNKFNRVIIDLQRSLHRILTNKKAISTIIGTVILTAGVLAMGIAVLYWAQGWGKIATKEYSETIANQAKAVQEKIAFEFSSYSTGTLTTYVIQWGTATDVTIVRIFIWDYLHNPITTINNPSVYNLAASRDAPLNPGQEGRITMSGLPNLPSGAYYMRIVTARGRTFDGQFSAP
jgi:hypothetical protein